MIKAKHVGNVTLIVDKTIGDSRAKLLLGLKRPKRRSDAKRRRKKVGHGRWVPAGGGTKPSDVSQKHSAQREVMEETGLHFPLRAFRNMGVLHGFFGSDSNLLWKVNLYLLEMSGSEQVPNPNEEYVEMKWFRIDSLPFREMLTGDREWIPKVLRGKRVRADIIFQSDEGNVSSCEIRILKPLGRAGIK